MDIKKEKLKSHVLLTRQLLKSYHIDKVEGKKVNVLNLDTMTIDILKVNEIDVLENYYYPSIERGLDRYIESPLGNVVDDIRNFIKNGSTKRLSNNSLNIIRRFFQFSILRNKEFFDKFLKTFDFSSFIPDMSHNMMLAFASVTDKDFIKKEISIVVNRTNKHFVCPHNVVYYFYNHNLKKFNLAITINKDLIFCMDLNSESDHIRIFEVLEENLVQEINYYAYLTEKKSKEKYIVGCLNDLKEIIEFKKNRKESN